MNGFSKPWGCVIGKQPAPSLICESSSNSALAEQMNSMTNMEDDEEVSRAVSLGVRLAEARAGRGRPLGSTRQVRDNQDESVEKQLETACEHGRGGGGGGGGGRGQGGGGGGRGTRR
eukprot:759998-Hanusia_phi.AAC.3